MLVAGFRDWLISEGHDPNTDPDADLNRDGFANVFHYLLDIPLHQFVQHDPREVAPIIDTAVLARSAVFLFKVPETLPPGITVAVEVTEDGKSWTRLATRSSGQATWQFDVPVLLVFSPPVAGLESVAVGLGKTYRQVPMGLFRMRVELDGESVSP